MYERDSQTLRRDEEQLRVAVVAKDKAWTENQAARLDVTPDEIMEAVRLGWLPEQIEGVSSKYALEGHPPPLESVLAAFAGRQRQERGRIFSRHDQG